MASVSQEYQVVCQSVNIAQIDRKTLTAPEPDTLIIFLSPIHGFNYPPIMLNFITHFPKGKNKVVLMNTRAGMLIGEFITPGLTGIAFYLSALILFLKGFSVKAILAVEQRLSSGLSKMWESPGCKFVSQHKEAIEQHLSK